MRYRRAIVRNEVKRQLISSVDQHELVLLKFTKAESQKKISWEHSKEFEYNQEMYDVVETEIKGDTIYFLCWWDHEETKLNKQLDNLVAQALGHDAQSKESQKQLIKFYKLLYYSTITEWQFLSYPCNQLTLTGYTFNCSTIYLSPPSLPPEHV
ncbi:MAG: hypothetical protein RIG62_13710 [Cyclobacteriaceae bacterium]